ncbi:restriction endonuclease subunit S [Microcella alkalica]|uniref:Type I restriction enzyme S subunit n=1 Tax=Microcella alkalica TaxID=355930 RepID=A0A839EC93_9MICO|nr:type I restriction enzyme S subunit [Microcella alkalica]
MAVSSVDSVPYAGVRWYVGGVYEREVVPASMVKSKSLSRIETGDIVYNRMWATKASFGVAGDDVDGCLVTNDFPAFRADPNQAVSDYIGLLFESKSFQESAAARATGTTERRRLKEADFLDITVYLPPLAEQRRIVDLIGAVDGAIEAADEVAETTAATYEAALQTISSSLYPRVTVGDVLLVAKAGGTPSRKAADYFGAGTPWLKSGEVDNPAIVFAEESITEAGLRNSSAWIAPAGSTVVAMYGQGNTKGTAGYLERPMAMNQAVIALVPDTELIDSRMLFHAMRSRTVSLRQKAIGAAQPNLSKSLVIGEEIGLPERGAQSSLAGTLDSMLDQSSAATDLATSLRSLRSNLLTALLTSEHEIPASYDVLLEGAA